MSQRPSARVAVPVLILAFLAAACGQATTTPATSATPPASVATNPSASPEPTSKPTAAPFSGLWTDATAATIGSTADWTNKVEIADIDGNGFPDLLFANGGDYETPGTPVASRVYLNKGPGQQFVDATTAVFGDLVAIARVIKVRDLNADSFPDIVMGTTYQTQSRLFLGSATGAFTVATDRLPQVPLSVGDVEIGDVDADGDLDIVLADWGPGSPMVNLGAPVRLWLNDGDANFTEATAAAMPDTPVVFSWELELLDADNDWDLDLAVSSKRSETSFLFDNDGQGTFSDVTADRMPHFTNNYEFEPADLDGDGYLDLVTINDGEDTGRGGREHVFRNDGKGGYIDATEEWWSNAANPGEDDNNVAFLDVESDGDTDFVIGALTGSDRLLLNDGSGHLTLANAAFGTAASPGTLGMVVVDLNGDDRPDVVDAQGENPSATDERVYLATDVLAPDTATPHVRTDLAPGAQGTVTVNARVTDGLSPHLAGRDGEVEVRWDAPAGSPVPLVWYGEYLFRGIVDVPAGVTGLRVCATDGAGNEACAPAE